MALSPTGDVAPMDGLAARYRLSAGVLNGLTTLAGLLARDPQAPTSVREESRVIDDHIADSLVALELDRFAAARAIVDIGSGAGLPGLALAIAVPDLQVTLIECSTRKVRFIAAAIDACRLTNARPVCVRAEAWPEGHSMFDAVTARAVDRLDVVAEYAAPLLRVGGTLVVWRGRRDAAAEGAATVAADELGLEVHEPLHVLPYPAAENRHLHVMTKIRETPARFPRRPGIAHKRPLGRELASDRARR